jgi:hypothetical protein
MTILGASIFLSWLANSRQKTRNQHPKVLVSCFETYHFDENSGLIPQGDV